MAGLVSDRTGAWLREHVDRGHTGPGGAGHSWSVVPTVAALTTRLLPPGDTDAETKAETCIPIDRNSIVIDSATGVWLTYDNTLAPSGMDAALTVPIDRAWGRVNLEAGQTLAVAVRLVPGGADNCWTLIRYSSPPSIGPDSGNDITHLVEVARRTAAGIEQRATGPLVLRGDGAAPATVPEGVYP